MIPKKPAMPVYDPASGENPFAWIIRTAPQVRAQRAHDWLMDSLTRKADQRAANQPIVRTEP